MRVLVAVRAAFESFSAAVNPTHQFWVPFCPNDTVSHDGLGLTAVHGQPWADLIATVPVPPAALRLALDAQSETEHVCAVAVCAMIDRSADRSKLN